MNAKRLLLVALLGLCSTAVLAKDGYGRSQQMVKEFRESQAQLKGKQFFAREDGRAAELRTEGKTYDQQFGGQNQREND